MSKVKAFTIDGITFWFPSNDHNPPHFHAKRSGQWEYRVFFQENDAAMFEVKWTKTNKIQISKQDKQQIAAMVLAHRADILLEWEAIHP